MKKLLLILLLCLFTSFTAKAYMPYYDVKANLIGGGILKHTKHLQNTVKGPTSGIEIAIEFLPQGKYNWEKYWKYPTIGIGVLCMDLGNLKVFGQAFAAYPYLLIPMVRRDYLQFNLKVGAGLAVLTKTWYDCDTEHGVNAPMANAAIGSHLNVFLPIGLNLDIPIKKGFKITTNIMLNHISNGSFIQPNSGLNIINGFLGIGYRPNWREYMFPWNDYVKPREKNIQLELAIGGGARQLYYRDNDKGQKFYGVASARFSFYKFLTSCYKIGASVDAFYDGVFFMQGGNVDRYTKYKRYLIPENNIANKFRVGFSLANEVEIGRVTAGLHWGFYVYDPIRNLYPVMDKNGVINPKYTKNGKTHRPLFYSYNIEKEDGWNYFRLLLKCRIVDNFYIGASLKTHLQKAEFFDIGFGYTFNIKNKRQSYSILE